MPPPSHVFFGGDLGTLRPGTFKLAFLAGGPPMPSTWEFYNGKNHHKIQQVRGGRVDGSWNTWRCCFFWTKKEIHIRCQMKLQYLHLPWALRKQNRIRKTKDTKNKRASHILGGEKRPFLHGLVHSQWSTIAKHQTAFFIIALSKWFMVDKSRVQSIS